MCLLGVVIIEKNYFQTFKEINPSHSVHIIFCNHKSKWENLINHKLLIVLLLVRATYLYDFHILNDNHPCIT